MIAEAYVGAYFRQIINLNDNPLLRDAEKYEVEGITRKVDEKTTNRLPDWITNTKVDKKGGSVTIEGKPKEEFLGRNTINIVAYHGGSPSYFKLFIDVVHFENAGDRRSFAPVERDE